MPNHPIAISVEVKKRILKDIFCNLLIKKCRIIWFLFFEDFFFSKIPCNKTSSIKVKGYDFDRDLTLNFNQLPFPEIYSEV